MTNNAAHRRICFDQRGRQGLKKLSWGGDGRGGGGESRHPATGSENQRDEEQTIQGRGNAMFRHKSSIKWIFPIHYTRVRIKKGHEECPFLKTESNDSRCWISKVRRLWTPIPFSFYCAAASAASTAAAISSYVAILPG